MKHIQKTTTQFFLATMVLLGASCDEALMTDTMNDNTKVSLSTSIAAPSAVKAKLADKLEIDYAKILVKSVKLHNIIDEDSLDFKSGSFVLTLDPDVLTHEVALTEFPFGVYDKLTFRVHKPEDGETPSDPDFMESESGRDRYSILLNGSYNGQVFEFKIRKSFKQRVNLDPNLVIDETSPASINLTLEVDLNSWFEDKDGNFIDPFGEDAEDEIEDAISRSFRMFKDNDHDGKDDDHDGDDDEHGDDDDDSGDNDDDSGDDGDDSSDDDSDNSAEINIEKQMINTGADSDASGEVEYEEEESQIEFNVEVEDLDVGTYDLYVGGNLITSIDVIDTGDGIEGEVEFRNPVETGKLELTFDPRGKTIEVAQDSTVYLTVDF